MKSMLKVLTALFVGVLVAAPALATNWVLIGDGHYIDTDSIRPAGYGVYNYNTEYLSRDNRPLEVVNGKEIYTITTQSYIDCRANFATTVSYTGYDKNKKAVVSGSRVGKQWYGINEPGSRAYDSYRYVCTDKYIQARPDYNPLWWY